jgi:hypothetical protein
VDHLSPPCQPCGEQSLTPLPYRQPRSDVRTANVPFKAEMQFCQSSASVMGLCSSSPSFPKSRHQDHASVRGQHEGRHTMP